MKALILDDEPPVIMVVRMLVDWEAFGIDTVFTGVLIYFWYLRRYFAIV